MTLLSLLVLLVAIGLLGSKIIFSKKILPDSLRYLFITGWEFILLGIILGPVFLSFLDLASIKGDIYTVIAVGLAWAGFVIGMELKVLGSNRSRNIIFLGVIESAVSLLMIFLLLFLIFLIFYRSYEYADIFLISSYIAASVSLSSPMVAVLLMKEFKQEAHPLIRKIVTMTTITPALSIFFIGFIVSFFHPADHLSFEFNHGTRRILLLLIIAVSLAVFLTLFKLETLKKEDESIAIIIGFITTMGGIAIYLHLSPLFLGMITGIFFSLFLKDYEFYHQILLKLEKPFYIVMLIIAGSLIVPIDFGFYLISVLVIVFRLFCKNLSIRYFSSVLDIKFKMAKNSALTLASHGPLTIAIALSMMTLYNSVDLYIPFSMIMFMVIANDIIAPFLFRFEIEKWVNGREKFIKDKAND